MSWEKELSAGYRWLKCDLHTHTPVSCDTPEMKGISESEWLCAYMKQEIDLVAITDHNTGRWIDPLKQAYYTLKHDKIPSFRPLLLIPGVEITTADGIHILALFDPSATTLFIEDFLSQIGSPADTRGESSCAAAIGTLALINRIMTVGGVAIPAHIDRRRGKGLLHLEPELLFPILESSCVRVVESLTDGHGWPTGRRSWGVIAGSDSHTLSSEDPYSRYPGCIYTMLYMKQGSMRNLVQAFTHPKRIRRVIPDHYIE